MDHSVETRKKSHIKCKHSSKRGILGKKTFFKQILGLVNVDSILQLFLRQNEGDWASST